MRTLWAHGVRRENNGMFNGNGHAPMQTAVLCSAETVRAANQYQPAYPPLGAIDRPTVPTDQAAHYLNRRPQTLRGWACAETFPSGLRPIRINGRLAWPVAGIRAALGV